MAQHTPGPWSAGHVGTTSGGFIYDQDGNRVCEVLPVERHGIVKGCECEANANLISAADDLLIALEAAYATFYRKDCELGLQVQAAISKAKGEKYDDGALFELRHPPRGDW